MANMHACARVFGHCAILDSCQFMFVAESIGVTVDREADSFETLVVLLLSPSYLASRCSYSLLA